MRANISKSKLKNMRETATRKLSEIFAPRTPDEVRTAIVHWAANTYTDQDFVDQIYEEAKKMKTRKELFDYAEQLGVSSDAFIEVAHEAVQGMATLVKMTLEKNNKNKNESKS